MKKTGIFIAHPTTDQQVTALKAFLKALKIRFEISRSEDSPYDPEFVKKIERGRKDNSEGKGTTVTLDDLNNLWK